MNPKDNVFCVFCQRLEEKDFLSDNDSAVAILDIYPVLKDHTLFITRRHVEDYFYTTDKERRAIDELIIQRRAQLLKEDESIAGFNIGINSGKVAGQTIFHHHVHLIPRRKMDIENPKGGVRSVIPEKKIYG